MLIIAPYIYIQGTLHCLQPFLSDQISSMIRLYVLLIVEGNLVVPEPLPTNWRGYDFARLRRLSFSARQKQQPMSPPKPAAREKPKAIGR